MASGNKGVCNDCGKRVPAEHVIRDGKVYLLKHCADCGDTEGLVSSDAAVWQRKRDIYQYDADAPIGCSLKCKECGRDHHPRLVFMDVTNRCNLNCPICIANIPGMGFEFNPPLSYFEKIFAALSGWDPKPRVELFGGEPTVRDDIFEIIQIARRHRVPVTMATNCLKLADEEYCKKVCETKTPLLIAFDGLDPEIYRRMRGSAGAYYKKLEAWENLVKYSKRKHTVACTVACGLNDKHMKGLIEFVHERRAIVRRFHFLPLTEMWEEGAYDARVMTTPEDVERIVDEAMDDKVEFLPAGMSGLLDPAYKFFGTNRLRFGGIHPNCESATYFFSDGERYRPPSAFLKRPLADLAEDFARRARKVNPKLERLDPSRWLQRWRGRLLALRAFGGLARGLAWGKIIKGNVPLGLVRIFGGALFGKSLKKQVQKHTNAHDSALVVVLPFEEPHSLEAARLERCSVGFGYVDPDTDEVKTMPFCVWCLYRKEMFRKIADKYQSAAAAS